MTPDDALGDGELTAEAQRSRRSLASLARNRMTNAKC